MGGPRKTALVALALAGALGISACGEVTKVTTGTYAGGGGAEAPYLNVGPLSYEVQISRALNPYMREDEAYFAGLTRSQWEPPPGEEWLGVFIQVYNPTDRPQTAAKNISIYDTQGNVYRPIVLPSVNQFDYRGGLMPPKARIPPLGAMASEGPTQGALLLFRIKLVSLDNRPLVIKIVGQHASEEASAELDT